APIARRRTGRMIYGGNRSRCWSSSASVQVSSHLISAPPVATQRSCWPVQSDPPAKFMVRAGPGIPTKQRQHRPPCPRATAPPTPPPAAAPAAPPAAPRPSPVALADRDARLREAGIPAAPIVALSRPFEDPLPSELASEQIDLVTLMFNYHDLGHLNVDRAAMNQAAFRALKPGGLYVIADHAGRPGTGISESGTLH